MNRKKIIIISLAVVLVVVAALLILLTPDNEEPLNNDNIVNVYEPEFMNTDEKTSFGIAEDSKIQVLKRGNEGSIDVYKIIREDNDIEYNLDNIGR